MPKKTLPATKKKVSNKSPAKMKKVIKKSTIKTAKDLAVIEAKELSKISTKDGQFKPTASMQIWVAASINIASDKITEISEECGVDRTNWYKWLKHPGFLEWYEQERERNLVLLRQKLDNIGLKKASSDFQYWKAMQKIAGRDISEEQPVQPLGTAVQFNFGANKYVKERKK